MKSVEIPRLLLQALVDMACASMDWGSGFLDTDDVENLRTAANILGINPRDVTPHDFRKHYKDPLDEEELKTLARYRMYCDEYRAQGREVPAFYLRLITELEARMAASGQTEPGVK